VDERQTNGYYMTELMPADSKQLKWIDDDTSARDMPYAEYNDGVDNDLQFVR